VKQYLDLLKNVLENGTKRADRTGVGTTSIFGMQTRYDLREGFPLVTTKAMDGIRWKGIVAELLWFLSGDTNANTLKNQGVNIWNAWMDPDGDLGPVYGFQWRNFDGHYLKFREDGSYKKVTGMPIGKDQISWLINEIKANPDSRRLIVSAWNPNQIEHQALPPCHVLYQFYVDGEHIDLQLYQRSCDTFLGGPYNIASYSLLLTMVAQVTGYKPRYFIHSIGDAHIYDNHIEQVKTQIVREPKPLPKLWINPEVKDIFSFSLADFRLEGYESHPSLKGNVAV
jgi:thymidylate synthase